MFKFLKKILTTPSKTSAKPASRSASARSRSPATACANCGHSFTPRGKDKVKCPQCGYTRAVTFRELGTDIDEFPGNAPIANPNPQRIHFGYLRQPLQIGVNMLPDTQEGAAGRELKKLFRECEAGERTLYQLGSCPAPNPYYRIAVLAKKLKDYALEIAACERLIEVAREYSALVRRGVVAGVNLETSPRVESAKQRLPKAKENLHKAMQAKSAPAKPPKKATGPKKVKSRTATSGGSGAPRMTKLERQCTELDIEKDSLLDSQIRVRVWRDFIPAFGLKMKIFRVEKI